MIRNHPDGLALAAILLLVPGMWGGRMFLEHARWNVQPIRQELRIEQQRFKAEQQRFRMEQQRIHEELRETLRLRRLR